MAIEPVADFAPAKLNLCLHVVGRRADGYHLLDSIVVFAGVGDLVTAAPTQGLSLALTGPESGGLAAEADNLVLRAARAMGVADAGLTLWKALPIASGIGGGSADAAATLRALSRLTHHPLPTSEAVLALGADVPVCLAGRPVRMQGVGEILSALPQLPALWVVLVNPRVPVPTPQVFAELAHRHNLAVPDLPHEGWPDACSFGHWLAQKTRNDLVAPALTVAPVLAEVQAALDAAPGCLLARMSGSGGTHFGLFATRGTAIAAERGIRTGRPEWWTATAPVLGQETAPALPDPMVTDQK